MKMCFYSPKSKVKRRKNIETFLCFEKRNIIFSAEEAEATTKQYQIQLSDDKFIGSLAFLTDISNHLNMLNLKLQGKKQFISQLVGHIENFCKKLVLFKASLQKTMLHIFLLAVN